MTALRIYPEELVPKPGARERIYAASESYQRATEAPARELAKMEAAKARLASDLAKGLAAAIARLPKPQAAKYPGTRVAKARKILAETAKKYKLEPSEICLRSRKHDVVLARQEVCYRLAAECPTLSYVAIGKFLAIEHTSVMSAIPRHARLHGLPTKVRYGEAPVMRAEEDMAVLA